jgi:hypothetical protein
MPGNAPDKSTKAAATLVRYRYLIYYKVLKREEVRIFQGVTPRESG